MPFPVGELLKDRDPEGTNSHLLVTFEDTLGEPDSTHSPDCVWQLGYRCFSGSRVCIYKVLSLFCACCVALEWGIQFGCIAFMHVYCFTPLTNYCGVWAHCMKGYTGACIQCCCGPICELSSLFMNNINITKTMNKMRAVTPAAMNSRQNTTHL